MNVVQKLCLFLFYISVMISVVGGFTPAENSIAYWSLDESTPHDEVGGYHGSIFGDVDTNPEFNQPIKEGEEFGIGGAYYFPNTNVNAEDGVETTFYPNEKFGGSNLDSFTISYWAKQRSEDGTGFTQAIGNYDSDDRWYSNFDPDVPRVGFSIGDNADTGSSEPVNEDEWHHVILVYDSEAQERSWYVDGDFIRYNGLSNSENPGSDEMLIGAQGPDARGGGDDFEGLISEVSIYDEDLSNQQITELFDYYRGGKQREFCDRRGPQNQCVLEEERFISDDNEISSTFDVRSHAILQSEGVSLHVSNNSILAGIWQGSFDIESEGETRIEAGAQFQPESGSIMIN